MAPRFCVGFGCALQARGLTARAFARQTDLLTRYVTDVVAGRHEPIPIMKERLAAALGLSVESLESWTPPDSVPLHRRGSTDASDLGMWLRDQRRSLDLSIADLAERSGISESSILQYELGRNRPQLRQLCRLALALNVSIDAARAVIGLPPEEPPFKSLRTRHRAEPPRVPRAHVPQLAELLGLPAEELTEMLTATSQLDDPLKPPVTPSPVTERLA